MVDGWETYELYHSATFPPASAMASATAPPIPSAAPVTMITLPFMLNCCMTFVGVSGTGLGNPGRGVWHSSMDIDILAVLERLVQKES